MGLFSLFKKKKQNEEVITDDGQAKYFKEGEASLKKTVEVKDTAKDEPKKAEAIKKEGPKKTENAKKEEPKKAATAKKAEEKKSEPAKKAATAKKPVKKAEEKTAKEELPKDEEISETDEEVTETETGKPVRNGKFDIRKSKDGRFYFNLYASNKQVIAYSQMYASISSAMNGIKSVIAHAPKASIEDTTLKVPNPQNFPKWEIYIDKAGEYRFRLYASNGSCICHSHGYASKATCKGGMESIQRFASESADIDKTYLKK